MAYLILVRALTPQDETTVAVTMLLTGAAIFALSVPLIYRKAPMNHFYGIRLRESFESKEQWYDINSYGGRKLAIWSWVIMVTGCVGLILPSRCVDTYVPIAIVLPIVSLIIPIVQTIRWIKRAN